MEIVYRKLKELNRLDSNPRTITPEDMEKLKESIQNNPDYLEARPLVLSDRTGELVIIDGNQRYEACLQLGLKEAPTALLHGLTEEREKEIVIRANVNNGKWDLSKLFDWDYRELIDWGVELPDGWDISPDAFDDNFSLPNGDKSNSGKMTFTLSSEQAELIKGAIDKVKNEGITCYTFGNDNQNGNAIYQIVKEWVEQKK